MADILIDIFQKKTGAVPGMALDEFIRRLNDGPFELIDGKVIPMSPNIAWHGLVTLQVTILLKTFLAQHGLGRVLAETPFVLSETSDWVTGSRVPDVMVYLSDKWAKVIENPAWKNGPIFAVPDLAIEVRSPTDRNLAVLTKVTGYLSDGVRVVWVLNPKSMTVTIHTPDTDEPLVLHADQTLTCELLPDFAVTVQTLFDE